MVHSLRMDSDATCEKDNEIKEKKDISCQEDKEDKGLFTKFIVIDMN